MKQIEIMINQIWEDIISNYWITVRISSEL